MNEVTQRVRARGTVLPAVAAVAALTAFLAFAPLASAASDPLASGTTSLTLKKGFKKKLSKNNVKLLKWGSGKVMGRTVQLAVSGGELDPTTGQGTVEQSGGFKLKHGKRTAPVTEITIDRTNKAVFAKVANARMKFGFLAKLSFAREGFGVNANAGQLKLTSKAAKRLNNKLGLKKRKLFKGGNVMSNAFNETQPLTVTVLAGGKASLVTNLETVKKFVGSPLEGGLGVKIEAVPPGEEEIALPPVLKFPIGGGTIAPDASSGIVQTTGGVKLVQTPEEFLIPIPGTTTMTLNVIWVDLGAHTASVEVIVESTISPELNLGNLARNSIADVNLVGATVKSDPAAHTVTVENAIATLQAVTAETLNSVFGTPLDKAEIPHAKFAPGDGLGTFSFTAQTQ